jgi:DNA-binding GntR family transcriptional regulator
MIDRYQIYSIFFAWEDEADGGKREARAHGDALPTWASRRDGAQWIGGGRSPRFKRRPLSSLSAPERISDALRPEGEDLPDVPALTQSQVLSERVYRAVLQMLAQGSLRRGAALRIGVLSKALAVSPTPVREALARLAASGLIAHEARKGYRIAPPLNAEQLKELMDARRLIEVGAIGHACRNGGGAFHSDLAAALEAQSAAVEALNGAKPPDRAGRVALEWRVIEADLRFHQVIFNHSNQFIRVMADALRAQLYRVRQSAEQGVYDSMPALAEHRMILGAVATGDPAAAELAMKRHIDLVESRSAADLALAEADRTGRAPDGAADKKR